MSCRIVVIGNGGFAVRCLKMLRAAPRIEVPLAVADPKAQVLHGVLESYCASVSLPLVHVERINAPEVVEAVRAVGPDYLLNAYSMQLIGPELLSLPRHGAINFHNGPLPRYRGLNVYSWAIVNGEREHGITWHLMNEDIDAGAILVQRMFPIEPVDTPTSLTRKGFDAGADALADLISAIQAGSVQAVEQDHRAASYYSGKDVPNGSYLDFSWSWERLERFARGLDFRPLPNPVARPTVIHNGRAFHPQRIRKIDEGRTLPPGTVRRVTDEAIEVQAGDAVVGLVELLDPELRPVEPRALADALGLESGALLVPPAGPVSA